MMIRTLMAIACVLISGMAGNSAAADDRYQHLYSASGISAHATADNGVLAKQIATDDAIVSAYNKVLTRLTLRSQRSRLPEPNEAVISTMISEYAILSERAGPASYSASLNVRFNRARVHAALRARGVGVVEVQAPALLIMPVRMTDGEIDWTDTEWRKVWASAADPEGVVPYRIFKGDKADRSYLSSGEASRSATTMALQAMRYDAEFSVMVSLTESDDGGMTMRLSGHDGIGPIDVSQTFGGLRGLPRPSLETLSAIAIGELEERWKTGVLGRTYANSAFSETREVLPKRGVLEVGLVADSYGNIPELSDLRAQVGDLVDLSPRDGESMNRIEIAYSGSVEALQTEFARRQFALVRAGDAWWLTPY